MAFPTQAQNMVKNYCLNEQFSNCQHVRWLNLKNNAEWYWGGNFVEHRHPHGRIIKNQSEKKRNEEWSRELERVSTTMAAGLYAAEENNSVVTNLYSKIKTRASVQRTRWVQTMWLLMWKDTLSVITYCPQYQKNIMKNFIHLI